VVLLELRAEAGDVLPPFTAGAHIDLQLAPGIVRSYSLLNSQDERERYVLAVQRDPKSRGGSSLVHDMLREGATLRISEPRNNFALREDAAHTVLFAGGIGITPIHSMVLRLEALHRSWRLHYCARTRDHAALRVELARYADKVCFNFDAEPGGELLDIAAVVRAAPAGSHVYCCGPLPMLAAFERATENLPAQNVHREYFSAGQTAPVAAGSYSVRLAKSAIEFDVHPGETILDKLIERDFDITYSCREGVCGSCETAVLEGTPDHHDLVLGKAEQAAGKTMMVCCSGARSPRLVLDL
jgi:vanillate O-demethylase ferredoxin subunit